MPNPNHTSIRTSHTTQPFSLGRLAGDLIIRYAMPPERAVTTARAFSEVLDIARETRGVDVVDSDGLRSAVDELLEGRPASSIASTLPAPDPPHETEGPTFDRPPEGEAILRLRAGAGAYAGHLLAAAAKGQGPPPLVDAVQSLLDQVRKNASRAAEGDAATAEDRGHAAYADAVASLEDGYDGKAPEAFSIDIRDILRAITDPLREIPRHLLPTTPLRPDPARRESEESTRRRPASTVFGPTIEQPGWQLEESLLMWKAIRTTDGDDEMRLSGSFAYLGQSGAIPPHEDEFEDDDAHSGNNHVLGRVMLSPLQTGTYYAVHLLTEKGVTDAQTAREMADTIAKILGWIASGVIEAGLGQAAAATGAPGAGLLASAVQELVFGPVLDEAGRIVGMKIREILRRKLGPKVFFPVPATVQVSWPGIEPVWTVKVQGHSMGTKVGRGEIRSQIQPNGMPYTKQIDGNARYTYQFRFRVG